MTRLLTTATSILAALVSCMPASSSEGSKADASRAEVAARPQPATIKDGVPGIHHLELAGAKPAHLYVPASYASEQPSPLVVMLHGAGGNPRDSVELVRRHADRLGFIVLAPQSSSGTWDIIAQRRYGPDVIALEDALRQVFEHHAVDPQRIAIAGFSDGASYALSLGLANGDLFRFILAFSPGFVAPGRRQGAPSIFVSHGVQDRVLPIQQCSRRIVPQLRSAGYQVDYREFPDGHIVPEELAASALAPLGSGRHAEEVTAVV